MSFNWFFNVLMVAGIMGTGIQLLAQVERDDVVESLSGEWKNGLSNATVYIRQERSQLHMTATVGAIHAEGALQQTRGRPGQYRGIIYQTSQGCTNGFYTTFQVKSAELIYVSITGSDASCPAFPPSYRLSYNLTRQLPSGEVVTGQWRNNLSGGIVKLQHDRNQLRLTAVAGTIRAYGTLYRTRGRQHQFDGIIYQTSQGCTNGFYTTFEVESPELIYVSITGSNAACPAFPANYRLTYQLTPAW